MKKILVTAVLFLTLCIVAVLSACGVGSKSDKIESINGNGTIYRYKIEKLELLDREAEREKVLETKTEFKYYYSSEELLNPHIIFSGTENRYNSSSESKLSRFFSEIILKETTEYGGVYYESYSNTYKTTVQMRVILGKCDKEYRPSYDINDGIITIEYYEASTPFSDDFNIQQKEMDSDTYRKNYIEYNKKAFELRNDRTALEKLKEDREKEYENTCIIRNIKKSYNINLDSVRIEYYE